MQCSSYGVSASLPEHWPSEGPLRHALDYHRADNLIMSSPVAPNPPARYR
jgi:hypothetical protein